MFLFFCFLAAACSSLMLDLSSQTRNWIWATTVKALNSNYQITRKLPTFFFFFYKNTVISFTFLFVCFFFLSLVEIVISMDYFNPKWKITQWAKTPWIISQHLTCPWQHDIPALVHSLPLTWLRWGVDLPFIFPICEIRHSN